MRCNFNFDEVQFIFFRVADFENHLKTSAFKHTQNIFVYSQGSKNVIFNFLLCFINLSLGFISN